MKVYAAYIKDKEIRKKSSSGGMFTALAEYVLDNEGVVFGAKLDADKVVKHAYVERKEQLSTLRGSKYVKSNLSGCYQEVKKFLDKKRKVLFVGTPCQIDGLKRFLGEISENLILVDIVCHGTPVGRIFIEYLEMLENAYGDRIKNFSFRDKLMGWHNFAFNAEFINGEHHLKQYGYDPYSIGFQECYFLTEGCYQCQYASINRVSDITIGDFWGYEDQNGDMIDTNEGISLVICNTEKGQELFRTIQDRIEFVPRTIEEALPGNRCLTKCFDKPKDYAAFWKDYEAHGFQYVMDKYLSLNGKVYIDQIGSCNKCDYENIWIVASDGVGSKGDEAMLRGALNLFQGKKITVINPRDELWRGWIVDRATEFEEKYVPLDRLVDIAEKNIHLVIIGADIMDGLYGNENGISRLNFAEKIIDLGGRVDIFSCSFRSNASIEIIKKIVNIGHGLHFHLRDSISLTNFEKQTGLRGEFFPDLAFMCETVISERALQVSEILKRCKLKGMKVVGINFNEHSCQGFYENPNDEQRKKYVCDVLEAIENVSKNVFWVIIPHDTKQWRGHISDEQYSVMAKEIYESKGDNNFLLLDNLLMESELLYILNEIDILISGRMHLTIAGLRRGALPIGYMGHSILSSFNNSEKFKGMYLEQLGRSDLLAETPEQLSQIYQGLLEEEDEIKEILERKNEENRRQLTEKKDLFRKMIGLSVNKKTKDFEITDALLASSEYIFQKELKIKKMQELSWDDKAEIKGLQEENIQLIHKLDEIREECERQREEILERNHQIDEHLQQLEDYKESLINKNGHIELLLQKERDYVNLLNTKGVRVLRVWWNFKEKLFPQGSKRKLLAKFAKKFLRHPIYMLKKCTPSRIKRTLHYMRTEDVNSISNRLDAATLNAGGDIERVKLDLYPVVKNITNKDDIEKLVLPHFENPEVSIIIPVYNQFHYTYNCIKSIIDHTENVPYEVILADDCSTDVTKDIDQIVENIVIAKTSENMRFLRNCNNAAKQARGEYIFFLNNDTQVQENWLGTLVELMGSDEKIGMCGSMLLYPDGALQEAGGIVWKDASAWNFGHLHGPMEPEFNYAKEVDYISGAAILIRKSLWEDIGGFDDRFAPAYYEDTDLAFEVRKHGYKVVYQPLSKVVHFEGISNGTDTSSGQKEYQIVNEKKFRDKWKNVLNQDQFANGEEIFLAKDRSRYKKQILVVDHYVPMHDKDAGGKCTFMYLQLFVKMGMKVTFIGDNFYPHQPYTQELNQMGIEVLYGNFYCQHWQEWLKKNAHYFDYVYLQRPHISIKYIDLIKEYSQAKILYFAHDLHHVREYREYELTGDEEHLKASEHWKKIEYELFDKTDVGHVVGSYEQGIMQKAFPNKPIRNIPLYMYESLPEGINKDFATREDIMYVGGFGHPPNIDAVLWFGKEVFPMILQKYPTMKWYVVGSKVTPEIQAMASDNIIIMGFVPDDKLEELYRNCRMAIVPLRVGAGVKGKVVESAYFQIPLITTTIGAEGLDDSVGNMIVEDDATKMADIVVKLYEDYDKLKKMSDAGAAFIEKYFTMSEAERIIRLDVEV